MKNKALSLSTFRTLFDEVAKLLAANPSKKYYLSVTEKRSLPANNIYYVWLPLIADTMCVLEIEARNYLKFSFGLPVLFNKDDRSPAAQKLFDSLTRSGFFNWSYEDKIAEMETREVTSIMSTKEHKQMRDQIQHFFAMQGLNLEYER